MESKPVPCKSTNAVRAPYKAGNVRWFSAVATVAKGFSTIALKFERDDGTTALVDFRAGDFAAFAKEVQDSVPKPKGMPLSNLTTFQIGNGKTVAATDPVFIRSFSGRIQRVFLDGSGKVRQLLWEGESLGTWPDYSAVDCYATKEEVPQDPPAHSRKPDPASPEALETAP